jgi:hypothetical protein
MVQSTLVKCNAVFLLHKYVNLNVRFLSSVRTIMIVITCQVPVIHTFGDNEILCLPVYYPSDTMNDASCMYLTQGIHIRNGHTTHVQLSFIARM